MYINTGHSTYISMSNFFIHNDSCVTTKPLKYFMMGHKDYFMAMFVEQYVLTAAFNLQFVFQIFFKYFLVYYYQEQKDWVVTTEKSLFALHGMQ